MADVLVTGGAGFIGSHLVTRLIEMGRRVRVLDDFSSGKLENLEHVDGRYECITGDIRDFPTCVRACAGVEFVLHEAAVGSVPKSIDDPRPSHDVNINGTYNVLLAAAQAGVRRVIYAGSSSVYGDSEVSPKHETLPTDPLSPYALQKLTGEEYGKVFSRCFSLETITLRYFNVFGARQDPQSQYAAAIPAFVTSILRGESPVIFGDGEQTRDFTHIDNVIDGNLKAMAIARTGGEVVNLACGGSISINEVIRAINKTLGTSVATRHEPERAGDVRHSSADIGRARELLGFEPVVSFDDGLTRAIEYYKGLM